LLRAEKGTAETYIKEEKKICANLQGEKAMHKKNI
jgi:hypothetical protein